MSKSTPADPDLWKKIKTKWHKGSKGGEAGKWNARKAQLAVKEYKQKGGTYIGPKKADNSLAVWTREDWGYAGKKGKSRYLPAGVRKKMTPAEKRKENARKRRATSKGKTKAAWTDKTTKLVKNNRKKVMKSNRKKK